MPDFRNLGVILRALIIVNLLAMAVAFSRNTSSTSFALELIDMAGRVEPPLLASLAILALLSPWLAARTPRAGYGIVTGIAVALAAAHARLIGELLGGDAARAAIWAVLACLCVFAYFRMRAIAATPAFAEARLQALTARIRPHFLFNSLNGVLGIIRSDPKRAEHALEELSDLFRVLMRENRELVTLQDEVRLCEQYLELEHLRLGERLRVNWKNKDCPMDAMVPPLMLQPLLENAVYHGIEPAHEPGEISIFMARHRSDITIEIANPLPPMGRSQSGNGIALANIRERLMLFFDLEARLETLAGDGVFRVRIRLPYRPSRSSGKAPAATTPRAAA